MTIGDTKYITVRQLIKILAEFYEVPEDVATQMHQCLEDIHLMYVIGSVNARGKDE